MIIVTITKQQERPHSNARDRRVNGVGVQLQESNIKLDTYNWTPT